MFKEALFSISTQRAIEPVDTPAVRTYVRTITVAEKDEMDATAVEGRVSRANMLITFCCKEDGSPEFDEFDGRRIEGLPLSCVEPIIDAAIRLNRLGAADVEATRKNSVNGRTASSDSASPS